MKTKIICLAMAIMTTSTIAYGQSTVELTFTGDNNGQYVLMDSIYIKNLTLGEAVTLYPGDTTLILNITGLGYPEPSGNEPFSVSQNNPNPFNGETSIEISVPGRGLVSVEVINLTGCRLATWKNELNMGIHRFDFFAGGDLFYLLSATYGGVTRTIKMLNSNSENPDCRLVYASFADIQHTLKSGKLSGNLNFIPGNELLVVGYADGVEAGFADSPEENRLYIVQFATNVACPGIDSVLYADQWYHTIQVFGQCWLKENLNVGTMVNGNQQQTNNGVIEKYCYANNTNICATDGGLYHWGEIMQYATDPGARGICPEGWHIPTDTEVKVLEGAADSYYKIGASIWNNFGLRGVDAGKNLKSNTGWSSGGNGVDLYDFRLLPTGYWYANFFSERTVDGALWTSNLNAGTDPFYRGFAGPANAIVRNAFAEPLGMPVRCLKDL